MASRTYNSQSRHGLLFRTSTFGSAGCRLTGLGFSRPRLLFCVPFIAPEGSIGGLFGFKATLRWFPEINLSDYGKTKYFGYGLQWSPNEGLMPTFPVDVLIGFFSQELDVGSLIDSSANTYFLGISKDFTLLTLYGGFAIEDSKMTVSYIQEDTGLAVTFDAKAEQKNRFTIGAKLLFFNLEMGYGKMATYSAGLMFGF